ncbi:hypothetical protein SAMN05444157_0486 [Frankineae bacterium MT45]|nr:hypothetical protein SAMN05444157_0486 [Frankineae bacterium MT45]
MGNRIATLTVDCRDAVLLANFWCRVLGWRAVARNGDDVTIAGETAPFRIDFMQMPEASGKTRNKIHLDLVATDTDQQTELERLISHGARPLALGDGEVSWHVLADPEGNEFCLLRDAEPVPPTATVPTAIETPVDEPPAPPPAEIPAPTPAPEPPPTRTQFAEPAPVVVPEPAPAAEPAPDEPDPEVARQATEQHDEAVSQLREMIRARMHRTK